MSSFFSDASPINSNNYTLYCLYFTNQENDELAATLFLNSEQMSELVLEFNDILEPFVNNEFFGNLAYEIYRFVKDNFFVGGFTFRQCNYKINYVKVMSPDVFKEESKCGRLKLTDGYYYAHVNFY